MLALALFFVLTRHLGLKSRIWRFGDLVLQTYIFDLSLGTYDPTYNELRKLPADLPNATQFYLEKLERKSRRIPRAEGGSGLTRG